MSLRITGGVARGRVLRTPVRSGIRPTSARVRQAWFSIIGHDLVGVRFLDAYAGSGLMGLEAWSRGAEVVCIEQDRRAIKDLHERIAVLDAQIEVRCSDAKALHEPFDVVFADPPYALDPAPIVEQLLAFTDLLGIETERGRQLPMVQGLRPQTKRFGSTELHVYRRGR